MNSLKIGISMRIVKDNDYHEERDALSHDWSTFSELTNMTLIHISNSKNVKSFLEQMDLDGVILSGGDNIGDTPKRDKTELEIINYCINKKLPIFGVCRGMQILNSFFQGNITTINNDSHVKKSHTIKIVNEKLKLSNNKYSVNSFHKNLIHEKSLGKSLKIFAISDFDNSIEGFFHEFLPIIGVMWHPEREPNEFNQILVSNFFKTRLE
jgi:N5-(cytidine 5'-diphosphoramidyl)-L-glutamine hydrolase